MKREEAKFVLEKFASLNAHFDNRERLKKNPPLLAHYTSIEVLEKIIRDEEIWLSNPLYMNDLEEVRFGLIEGQNLFLTSQLVSLAAGTAQRTERLRDAFTHYYQMFDSEGALDIYVFCLCEHARENNDGMLSMWRGYGGHGNGAALIFETAALPDPPAAPLYISRVRYGSRDDRLTFLNQLLTEWSAIVRGLALADDALYLAAYAFFIILKIFALTTKHDGFLEEMEWRVIYVPENDPNNLLQDRLSYSIGAQGVEPKLKFKIEAVKGFSETELQLTDLLVRIILGPTVSSHPSVLATRRMLRSIGKSQYSDRVVASCIPLRPRGA